MSKIMNPFDIVRYCAKYPKIYPHNIAECLGVTYNVAEIYFSKYKKLHPNKNRNNIDSIPFFIWYFDNNQ